MIEHQQQQQKKRAEESKTERKTSFGTFVCWAQEFVLRWMEQDTNR